MATATPDRIDLGLFEVRYENYSLTNDLAKRLDLTIPKGLKVVGTYEEVSKTACVLNEIELAKHGKYGAEYLFYPDPQKSRPVRIRPKHSH